MLGGRLVVGLRGPGRINKWAALPTLRTRNNPNPTNAPIQHPPSTKPQGYCVPDADCDRVRDARTPARKREVGLVWVNVMWGFDTHTHMVKMHPILPHIQTNKSFNARVASYPLTHI